MEGTYLKIMRWSFTREIGNLSLASITKPLYVTTTSARRVKTHE